jgi:hypothetical protein
MDTYFRKLRQDGIGVEIKHTGVISKEEESLLWERGILGTSTPLALLRSVFYYNGKIFCHNMHYDAFVDSLLSSVDVNLI